MAYYKRSYFDKDNFIVRNSEVNYGGEPNGLINSKNYYIFDVNTDSLTDDYNDCMLADLSNVKHRLHIKSNFKNILCDGINSPLYLFPINIPWEEGCSITSIGNCVDSPQNGVSNYYFADNSGETWDTFFNFEGEPLEINSFIEEDGDLIFDVTDHFNDILSGLEAKPYGYALYSPSVELIVYARETGTFFKPFLETYRTDVISDSCTSIVRNTPSKVYLDLHDRPNLDFEPNVSVNDVELQSSCVFKNVFESDLFSYSGDCDTVTSYWSDIYVSGVNYDDMEFSHEVKKPSMFDEHHVLTHIKVLNINYGEKINCDNKRFINVIAYDQDNKKMCSACGLEYQIYVKQGVDELVVTPWLKVNSIMGKNWFYMDTAWMLKQEYHLKFRFNSNNIVYPLKTEIKYHVI